MDVKLGSEVNISSLRLILRELDFSDLENIHFLHSLDETDKYNTLGIPENKELSKELLGQWIACQNVKPREKYVLCIENQENCFVGLIALNLGKAKYLNAEIWYKLLPQYWRFGYATEAVKSLLSFSFNVLKLHRITAGCATQNIASIKVLEKSGFKREGSCRKILPIRGNWVDNYLYAILEEDFY